LYTKKCLVCEKDYNCKRSDKKYCSDSCYKKAKYWEKKKAEKKECPECKRIFLPTNDRQTYCSPRCQKKFCDRRCKSNKRFSGNDILALERDGYKCVMCGSTKGLNVHHKDESGSTDKPNNELSNLITLCNACHISIHGINRWTEDDRKVTTYCAVCGKEIITTKGSYEVGHGKYCSNECKYKSMSKKKSAFLVNCEVCGKSFYTTEYKRSLGKGKYCSRECAIEAQRGVPHPKPITKQITVQCKQCGKDMITTQARLDADRGRYCGKECQYEAMKTMPSMKKKVRKSLVMCTCQTCGKKFEKVISEIKSGRGKYCSRQCYYKAKKTS